MPDQKQIKVKVRKTATRVRAEAPAPSPVTVIHDEEPEYTDEQFYADLRKAGKKFDVMAEKALKDHAQGKTEKFPA